MHSAHDLKFPRDRIAPIVQEWIERHDRAHGDVGADRNLDLTSGREALAIRAEMNVRTIYRILSGREGSRVRDGRVYIERNDTVTLTTVDRLFCAMDCVHLFHTAAEDGGIADLYYVGLDVEATDDALLVAA